MSVRSETRDKFKKDWVKIPVLSKVNVLVSQKEVSVDSKVTVVISQTGIERFAPLPLSHRSVLLSLALVSPLKDVDAGTDDLEVVLSTLLDYLDGEYAQPDADFGLYGERAAYRIPISVTAKKVS